MDIIVLQFEQTLVPTVFARFEALGLVYVAVCAAHTHVIRDSRTSLRFLTRAAQQTEHPSFENGTPPPGRQQYIGRVCFSLNHKGLNEIAAFKTTEADHVSYIDYFSVYGDVWTETVESDTLLITGDGLGW